MSLTAAIALATLARGDDKDAVELLGKVILHYRNTVSANGAIRTSVTDGRGVKVVDTDFAYEKPSALSIRQTLTGPGGWTYRAISDGRFLMYDTPITREVVGLRTDPLPVLESIKASDGSLRTVPDLYGGFRPALPTAENPPLDIIFSRREHLEFLRDQWGTIGFEGKEKVNGVDVTWIGGDFKPVRTYVGGHWRMAVSSTDDIVRYELRERISEKPNDQVNFVTVVYTFDVAVKLGETIPPEKFELDKAKVRRVLEDMKANGKDISKLTGGL